MYKKSETLTRYWQRHFDKNVDKYGDDHAMILDYKNEMIMEQIHKSIIEAIPLESNTRLLDAGCGLGDLTKKICLDRDKIDLEFFHIELSEKMLIKAMEYLAAEIGNRHSCCNFITMDLMDLGFGDRVFDVVISVESLQHVNIRQAITELVRVTKDGGVIAISIPNKKNPIIRKAEERNHGRFQGADIISFMEFLQNNKRVRHIQIKPLIFAEDQREMPYSDAEFKMKLTAKEAELANRFVFCINV